MRKLLHAVRDVRGGVAAGRRGLCPRTPGIFEKGEGHAINGLAVQPGTAMTAKVRGAIRKGRPRHWRRGSIGPIVIDHVFHKSQALAICPPANSSLCRFQNPRQQAFSLL